MVQVKEHTKHNTKLNLADETSRKIYSQGEWMLARTIFPKALRFNITQKIDLFALRSNNQLSIYILQTRSKYVRSRPILLRLE